MKKYFEYIGLLAFACFSFYYTEKVTYLMNSKDPLMIRIKDYKEKTNTKCQEGYITSKGVVLGVSGIEVNVKESYSAMQGYGYNESLMVFDEVSCKVNLESTIDNYILKANESTNSVSLFITINDGELLEEFLKVSKQKNIKVNLILTGSTLETYKEDLKDYYLMGYDIVYGGVEVNDFKKYLKIMRDYEKNPRTYCINLGIKDTLDMCKKENVNSIKTDNIYTKDILLNTKYNMDKGEFFVYKENSIVLEELSSTINFIKGKNLNIESLSKILGN